MSKKYLCASNGSSVSKATEISVNCCSWEDSAFGSTGNIRTEKSLNDFVMMKYKKLEFVNSIVFQKCVTRELRFYVYFESKQYDSDIMDQLISTELEILDRYPGLPIDIIYCPQNIKKEK